MNNTFRMSEIVLSVPALGIPSRNSDGSISLSGEHITAHVYAVKGNERLLVGRRDFAGMTASGYGYSLTVIKPEGYQLVVETVDKYGVRDGTSRVLLSSEKEAKPVNGWHLNKSGTAHVADEPEPLHTNSYNMTVGIKVGAGELQAVMEGINKLDRAFETFSVQVGKNFINDAYIQDGTIQSASISDAIMTGHSAKLKSKADDRQMKAEDEHDPVSLNSSADKSRGGPLPFGGFPGPNVISAQHAVGSNSTKFRLSDDMGEAVLDAVRNSDLFQSLVEQVNAQSAAHASTVISLQKGIEQALNDTIRNALQPGGLLFNRGR
ncbi:phage tail tip fiber protein [Atlantibacter hermannii]|uniref:phage tail tip fiber protein n=1 Tax=Atlantibacter hermannii TaxID=565 RepID=UPI0022B7AE41|nr:hypothetical protein [Atlantibacter hermannii]MCZ7836048.1 hypothetical protein [Atlantibacter hermannii]